MHDTPPPDGSLYTKRILQFRGMKEAREAQKGMNRSTGVCSNTSKIFPYITLLEELKRIPQHTDALWRKMSYTAEYAQRDFLQKQQNKGNIRKLDKDPQLREAIVGGYSEIRVPNR